MAPIMSPGVQHANFLPPTEVIEPLENVVAQQSRMRVSAAPLMRLPGVDRLAYQLAGRGREQLLLRIRTAGPPNTFGLTSLKQHVIPKGKLFQWMPRCGAGVY